MSIQRDLYIIFLLSVLFSARFLRNFLVVCNQVTICATMEALSKLVTAKYGTYKNMEMLQIYVGNAIQIVIR